MCGLGYDIEDVSVVTDSTFIKKMEQDNPRHNEIERYSDSDLSNKLSGIHNLKELKAYEENLLNQDTENQKFGYCDAYLNSGQWKRTITKDTFRECPKTKECRESIWDSQVSCGVHYFTPTDVRSCLSGVNFHMFGDSRTRQLFFALKAFAQGQFNLTDDGGRVNRKYDENGLNIKYYWSPKLSNSKPFYPKLLKQLESEENPTKNWIYMID